MEREYLGRACGLVRAVDDALMLVLGLSAEAHVIAIGNPSLSGSP
jgi:hypothetical protein